MAIYHLTANIISRGRGQSVVAAAAYRAAVTLHDRRYGITHYYGGKRQVAHAEIIAPDGAPDWARNREVLWNTVEFSEGRKDAQLARAVEIGLPVELDAGQRIALMRDYVAAQFVARGMIADFCIGDAADNPRAHVLLTLRTLTAAAFGPKERGWNGKAQLFEWRRAWAAAANAHLARAGHAVRIDHRTLEAQQIELRPGRRIGIGRGRRGAALPGHFAERFAEQQRIAAENGNTILEDPAVALQALTHQRAMFTDQHLEAFLRSRCTPQQFAAVLKAVRECGELVATDSGGQRQYTSRDMLEAHKSLMRRAQVMATRQGHGVAEDIQRDVSSRVAFDEPSRRAFEYLVSEGDAKAVVLDDARPLLLGAAGEAWTLAGWAMAASPAESIERCAVTARTVLLVEDVQAVGIKELERVMAAADKVRAKVVLVADRRQFAAMQVGCAFADVLNCIGAE